MIAGFKASLLETVTNENEILATHGRRLNEILNKRMSATLDTEKAKGSDYLEKYLKENSSAKKLASGLVYHETVPGLGQQVCIAGQASFLPLTLNLFRRLLIPLSWFTTTEPLSMETSSIAQLTEESLLSSLLRTSSPAGKRVSRR